MLVFLACDKLFWFEPSSITRWSCKPVSVSLKSDEHLTCLRYQALDSVKEKLRLFFLKTLCMKLGQDTELLMVAQKQNVCSIIINKMSTLNMTV